MNPEDIAGKTFDPKAASKGIERLLSIRPEMAKDTDALEVLSFLFAGSEFLTDWLIARPTQIDWLLADNRLSTKRNAQIMASSLAELMADNTPAKALRLFKHRELCRICIRELGAMAPLQETMEEWSQVADTAIDAAIRVAESAATGKYGRPVYTGLTDHEEKVGGFAAVAMGKLGGRELNISSDVDLIYVHSSDNGTTTGPKQIPIHEFFVRIARDVTSMLSEITEDGFVFRVDLDLRPEGKAGEVTNSIGAMETYYESWGRQWERQALIKARHCGGDPAVSKETLDRLAPFVYRKYLDDGALAEIAGLKEKIDQSLKARKGPEKAGRDIKLGKGGIREIEFIAQTLQLLYGAHYTGMRTRRTLGALDICESLGFLSQPHHRDLKEHYIFFRRLENRVQYFRNQQTHLIPNDTERLFTLGRSMGIALDNPGERLVGEIDSRRKRVREIFDMFFVSESMDSADSFPVSLDDEQATAAWLDSLRFDHPLASARALNLLRNGSAYSHPSEKSRMTFDRFGPSLVLEATSTSWPDHVILGFSNFVETKGGRDMLYELLDGNRPVIKLLAAIFSSSESLSTSLLRQPDLLDRLLVSDPVGAPGRRGVYSREFGNAILSGSSTGETLAAVNSIRSGESLRLGLRRILGMGDRFELMSSLTVLAEEYVRAISHIAIDELYAEFKGNIPDVRWALIAAGKLGKGEMNFGSDIDLLAFYEGPDKTDNAISSCDYVTRVVQSIIRLSGSMTKYGSGYQMDMRLRPEGEAGTLVSSLDSMIEYYKTRGQAWEMLALVGARPIVGDDDFGGMVMTHINNFIASWTISEKDAEKIAQIREKIARQRVKPDSIDIKFGRGGLIEIEFICQWLSMERGVLNYANKPFTISAIKTAKKEGWLAKTDISELEKAYKLYRSIEDTLRMDREQAVNILPKNDRTLLRRMSQAVNAQVAPNALVELVKNTMKTTRAIYLEFIRARTGARDDANV